MTNLERFAELLEGFPKQYTDDIFRLPAGQPMFEFFEGLGPAGGYELQRLAEQYAGNEPVIKILAKYTAHRLKATNDNATLAAYFARPAGEPEPEQKPTPPAAAAELAIVKQMRKPRAKAKPKAAAAAAAE